MHLIIDFRLFCPTRNIWYWRQCTLHLFLLIEGLWIANTLRTPTSTCETMQGKKSTGIAWSDYKNKYIPVSKIDEVFFLFHVRSTMTAKYFCNMNSTVSWCDGKTRYELPAAEDDWLVNRCWQSRSLTPERNLPENSVSSNGVAIALTRHEPFRIIEAHRYDWTVMQHFYAFNRCQVTVDSLWTKSSRIETHWKRSQTATSFEGQYYLELWVLATQFYLFCFFRWIFSPSYTRFLKCPLIGNLCQRDIVHLPFNDLNVLTLADIPENYIYTIEYFTP